MFADDFLSSLDQLPRDHALNQDLRTFLEIVVSREDGRLVRMGVTRASGSTAFDVGALESVQRASPFGPPPKEIVSPDGNVYLHWVFHRNPVYACSTYFARPYLLRVAPTPAPQPPAPAPPAEPEEGRRHGQRIVPTSDQDG
jgi:TonB family protein